MNGAKLNGEEVALGQGCDVEEETKSRGDATARDTHVAADCRSSPSLNSGFSGRIFGSRLVAALTPIARQLLDANCLTPIACGLIAAGPAKPLFVEKTPRRTFLLLR